MRPTAERVREAWLNILTPWLEGARVLDLYAGTGALGLEALSRGAAHATFVERHAQSLGVLRANIAALDASGQSAVVVGDATQYASSIEPGAFDLALADPPFDSGAAEPLVRMWHHAPFAAIFAVEHARSLALDSGSTRRWGDIAVTFLGLP